MKLTILGLGPGHPDDLTRRAWQVLQEAPTLVLRTSRHPIVDTLERPFTSFDDLYEQIENFETLYQTIVERILELANSHDELVYAVPGHPLMGEQTVTSLLEKAGDIPVEIIHGLSFIEPALSMLHVDGMTGLQVYDGVELSAMHHPPLNPDHPALLGQIYNARVASDVKLTLMNQYPDEHPVTLLHGAGLPDAFREDIPLYEIDRSERLAHLTALYIPPLPLASSMERFQETIAHLRAPEGCPWDRKQTHESLRPYLLEETYEVLEALDNGDLNGLCEELGDLLLQIVLHSQIAVEAGSFSMADIIARVNAKIIYRHPHVWGDAVVNDLSDLQKVWQAQKIAEKGEQPKTLLGSIPIAQPALVLADKYQQKAAKVGFDWADVAPVIDKIFEEIDEIKTAPDETAQAAEVGDLLFAVVNWSRWLKVDPEIALREANTRFRRRFEYVEEGAKTQGRNLSEMSLEEMDALWEEAKSAGH
jgi:tetrapyrrole methylase family protein / MazG family protein